jgi:hypothetical protein
MATFQLSRGRREASITTGQVNRAPRPAALGRERDAAAYRIYGLALQSSLALPCRLARPRVRPDVRLEAGTTERFARVRREIAASRPRDWFRWHRLADGTTYLHWSGSFEFLISADGRRIRYHCLDRATHESFSIYLLGQVLSFSLLAFGVESLHGTAVVVNGEAIVFVGDCSYGKSTLGAALLARGFPILTDDLVVTEQDGTGWVVHPGIPRIKLFPSVARKLLLPRQNGTRLNHGTSKLVLPLNARQAVDRITPLGAIYVLSDPRHPESRDSTCPRIEPLSGSEAFLEIVRAAFNLLVLECPRLINQFEFATALAADVPVRRLTYRRHLSSLPAVCDAVLSKL